MANVPTILADRSIRTGSTGPEATAASFGSQNAQQLDALGNGIERLGQGARQASADLHSHQEQIDHLNATIYNTDAESKFRTFTTETYSENKGSDTLHSDYKSQSDGYITALLKNAPTPEAKAALNAQLTNLRDSAYHSFSQEVVAGKLAKAEDNVLKGVDAATGQFNTFFANDPVKSSADYIASVQQAVTASDSVYAKLAPKQAEAVRSKIIGSAVMGAIDTSPSTARKMIDAFSGTIPGSLRQTLLQHIEAAQATGRQIDRIELNQTSQDVMSTLKLGNAPDPERLKKIMDPSYWVSAYGEKGLSLQARAVEEVTKLQKAQTEVSAMAAWNPSAKQLWLVDKQGAAQTEADRESLAMARQMVDAQNLRLAQDTPAYLESVHPDLASLRQKTNQGNSAERAASLTAYQERLLYYQGPPPADQFYDMTKEQRAQFLSLPEPRLMSQNEVQMFHSAIESAQGPEAVFEQLVRVKAQYPDPGHYNIALTDLFRSKDKAETEVRWRAIAENLDKPWAKTAIEALQVKEAKGDASSSQKAVELWSKVDASTADLKLATAYSDPNGLSSYRELIYNLSKHRMAGSNLAPEKAAREMTQMVVGSNAWIKDFGGISGVAGLSSRKILIPKKVAGVEMSDDFADSIPPKLKALVDHADLTTVDWGKIFPETNAMTEADKEDTVRQKLQDRVTFTPTTDGTKLQAQMVTDFGNLARITDFRGQPLMISIKDLQTVPDFPGVTLKGVFESDKEYEKSQASYSLYQKGFDALTLPNSNWKTKAK